MKKQLEERARKLKNDVAALFLACKRPDTPFIAKLVTGLVVAYALSPIDIIPDFIPILGYLDDLILLPFGIALALKLIPPNIMEECRLEAVGLFDKGKPKNIKAGIVIVILWSVVFLLVVLKIVIR